LALWRGIVHAGNECSSYGQYTASASLRASVAAAEKSTAGERTSGDVA
jgi:hypothetical protein